MNIARTGQLLKKSAFAWLDDNCPRLGAALAFYSVFSLAPLLLVVIGIAGLAFGREAAQSQLLNQVRNLVGTDGAKAIETMLQSASRPEAGWVGTVLGIIMLLFGAAGVFGELQSSLNTIWKVKPKPGGAVWSYLQARFLSLTMVLGVAFLLLVSLSLSAFLAGMVQLLGEWQTAWIGHLINEVVSLIVFTALFAMIFKILPDVEVPWRYVWLGGTVTALLFEGGKFLIGLYLGHSGVASAYGAAGSLAVLLLWLYYSAQIFLYGAELTRLRADTGSEIVKPSSFAEVDTSQKPESEHGGRHRSTELDKTVATGGA
jgi:membrane protein